MHDVTRLDTSVTEAVTEDRAQKVLSLAQSMVSNREKAFEIARDAFCLTLNSCGGACDAESFEKRLFSACRSICLNSGTTPSYHIENPSLRALNSLPVKYRSILILNDVFSFTLQQTAQLWDINEQKAEQRLVKGRMLIGEFLKKQISE